ncbi:MAG: guanylate kinase [Candidatus Cloacimonetes bacterium]|nr:guanylate kinase [Candidatus Cloacimonadota bacterium]
MISPSKSFLIILSAPSGGGKSSILTELIKTNPRVDYSISYTTRAPRGEEQNGIHYHFVTEDEFFARKEQGDFLETANVFGRWYGTSISYIRSRLDLGRHVAMDIDVQGAAQITHTDVPRVKIFIIPPSMQILRERLIKRGTDSMQEIEKRLRIAHKELKDIPDYDYLVINDDLHIAVQDVQNIIAAEEHRVTRYHSPAQEFLGETHDD